ncbi:MAG: acetate kinase [Venatoribacter sp.]
MSSVLVINCGSSSAKLALYENPQASTPIVTALAERLINEKGSSLRIKGAINQTIALPDQATHRQAIKAFIAQTKDYLANLIGIGHRVVHGGERFHQSIRIDSTNLEQLRPLSALAPLHNPANVQGIDLCFELFPGIPQVAVFDTSFHQNIEPTTFLYGTPYSWYKDYGVRRYGFHGISYRYVAQQTADRLKQDLNKTNLVILHLGNGCSATAVRDGKSVDSSMGLTPLEGLIMGTRCGDIDPGLIEHMLRSTNMSFEEIMHNLNRNSGLKGLSGLTNDMRSLLEAEAEGHEGAKLAIDIFCFRAARNIAALATSLPRLDAVVFTGGIGENARAVRERILAAWQFMHFEIDPALNAKNGDEQGRITTIRSPLALVVATNEELLIAQDTYQLVNPQ